MSTIVTRAGKGSPLTHTEVDNNFTNLNTDKAEDSAVVKLSGNQTIAGTKTFSSTITGSISGNAGTATNGVVTSGSYADPSWITSINYSKLTGTVPTWNQNTTGNAATVTNGVYTNTNQTITGGKAFLSDNISIANGNGYLTRLEAQGTGGAAVMQFHRPGAFAAYFGIDSDNQWKVGGWSYGSNSYVVHSDNNCGRCVAWVNFNGTGTVAIRASFNVTSITDNGTGNYRVNFNALADANYSVVAGAAKNDTNNDGNFKAQVNGFNNGASNANSTTGTTVMTGNSTIASIADSGVVTVAVFR